jgi:hypothetical protein
VTVDEQLLRPERRRVAATPEAFRTLAETHPRARIEDGLALMARSDDGSEQAFELLEDGWEEASNATPSQRPLDRHELSALLADAKAQLALLRGLYDSLLGRVLALESASFDTTRSLPPRVGRRVPSRKSVLDSLRGGAPPAAAQPVVAPRVSLAAERAASLVPASAGSRDVPEGVATQVSPGAPLLSVPGSADVIACLQMLVPDLTATSVRENAPATLADYYVAVLRDESDEPIAALLFNQRASADLGAGIMGASAAERDEQARHGLTPDALDGLNEVANNLTGLLNRTNQKRPVRLQRVEHAPANAPGWLQNPAKKLAFSWREQGAVFLLVRGAPA